VGFGAEGVAVDVEVRHGGRLLVLREAAAPRPPGGSLDVRAPGLWLSLVDERDGRWTLGLESFGLAVEHPDDERGDLVPLGLDVEVEPEPDASGGARLVGDLLVGDEVVALDEPATWRAG
jgi:hypothetical protein